MVFQLGDDESFFLRAALSRSASPSSTRVSFSFSAANNDRAAALDCGEPRGKHPGFATGFIVTPPNRK
jgi:hypothetical protein